MPTYANLNDLNDFFSSANITDWADKNRDGTLNAAEQSAIDRSIQAAEAVVDGYLRRAGYAAPFDATAFGALPERLKSLLRQWTVIVAGFHLYAWRGIRDKVNPIEAVYHETLAQLKNIADGVPLAGLQCDMKVRFNTGETFEQLQTDAWDW